MAANLNKTKRRINSINSTKKITKAMELVATVKLKRFKDGEAEVFGYSPLFHNNNPEELDELGYTVRSTSKSNMVELEALGSLEVLDIETGVAFNIGSGFTANQRKELWKHKEELLGKVVKYKYFDVSILNAPRFPIFLGFRDKEDM